MMSGMAITVTYTDGQVTEYDDKTWWEVTDAGLLRIGSRKGVPDLLVSPSGWSSIDLNR